MAKVIVLIMLAFLLSGCWRSSPPRIRTEVQEQYVPLLFCPAPDWEPTQRPSLPIDALTEKQRKDPGEVAKYYKATIKVLQGYTLRLERALLEYDRTNEAYDELRSRFKSQWKSEFQDAKMEIGNEQ